MSIPLKIVTGFLGSGKTSVLQHAACNKYPRGKVAVFIREYLETPFDRDRVVGEEHEVHMIAGDPGNWELTVGELRRLVEQQRYAMILLEVVDPTEAYTVARAVQNGELPGLYLSKTAVVIDGAAFHHHIVNFPVQMSLQCEAADVLIVNKNDMIQDFDRDEIRAEIAKVNPDIEPVFTYMGQFQSSLWLDDDDSFTPRLVKLTRDVDRLPRLESTIYTSNKICFDRVMFGHKLLNSPANIVRFKGVLKSHDRSYGLTGVPGILDWDANVTTGETRIAFVGVDLSEQEDELKAILDGEIDAQYERLGFA